MPIPQYQLKSGNLVVGHIFRYPEGFVLIPSPTQARLDFSNSLTIVNPETTAVVATLDLRQLVLDNIPLPPSSDSKLLSITPIGLVLQPAFDPAIHDYTATGLLSAFADMDYTVVASSAKAVVTLNGVIRKHAVITSTAGVNIITIIITAEDGTATTYRITVTLS